MSEPPPIPPETPKARIPLWLMVVAGVAFLVFSLSLGGLTWWLVSRQAAGSAKTPASAVPPVADRSEIAPEPVVPVVAAAPKTEPGFVSLFNGRDLDAWVGDPVMWSVQNGVLRGSTKKRFTAGTWSCLFWQGRELQDFELRFSYWLVAGNSGVYFRARQFENFAAAGYQFDIAANNVGTLLDLGKERTKRELFRSPGGEPGWHEVSILVAGNRIVHRLDGEVLCDLTDVAEDAPREGWLAFELAGGPTTVEFKDIRLRSGDAKTVR